MLCKNAAFLLGHPVDNIHCCKTRPVSGNNLFIPGGNTQKFQKTVSYSGSVLWNEIPDEIRMAQTLEGFKDKFKKHLPAQQV